MVAKYPNIDWDEIKEIWCTGVGSLGEMSAKYEIPLPAILLAAQEEKWEDRDSPWRGVKPKEPLQANDVKIQHKVQLGMIRELTGLMLVQLDFADGISGRVKLLDKLSAITVRNINLERVVFGLDMDSDGSPDAITINQK